MDKRPSPAPDKRAILIAGPTASGKSALAISLAERVGGVVVNADSMQLYKDLRIVTARPSEEEEQLVPHRLYGVLSASEPFSTGAWLRLMDQELQAIWNVGQVPVLVGGTGLYFKALTEGFADLPDIPEAIRAEARELAAAGGIEALKAALTQAGDEDAATALNDPQRLARALEVRVATGRSLADWQSGQQADALLDLEQCLPLVLAPPRPWLHERIERRAGLMLAREGLAEVAALLAQNLPWTLPAMRAIGVKEISAFHRGEADLVETAYRLTVATRQYAKRQETWFRNQMACWQRIDPSREIDIQRVVSEFDRL